MIIDNSVFVETGFVVETGLKPVSTHGIFEFVRALKTFSSRGINNLEKTAGKQRWQTRFHDHIIHDEQELKRIQQYIHNNPSSWVNDSLNAI
jgi:REP element-mobilizing transposase RayT